jgi:hypothetical protein
MIIANRIVTAIAAATLALGFGVASAAEPVGAFARINGVAMVSQGARYVKAHEGMPLYDGDRLLVMDGGSAIIKFADGCRYTVHDNEILTIGATSTCASGAVGSDKVQAYNAIAYNPDASQMVEKAAMGGPPTPPPPAAVAATANLGWVVGAAGGLVAVMGGTLPPNSGNHHNRPPISR